MSNGLIKELNFPYCTAIHKATTKWFHTAQDLLHNPLRVGLGKIRERSTGLSEKNSCYWGSSCYDWWEADRWQSIVKLGLEHAVPACSLLLEQDCLELSVGFHSFFLFLEACFWLVLLFLQNTQHCDWWHCPLPQLQRVHVQQLWVSEVGKNVSEQLSTKSFVQSLSIARQGDAKPLLQLLPRQDWCASQLQIMPRVDKCHQIRYTPQGDCFALGISPRALDQSCFLLLHVSKNLSYAAA